MLEWISELPKKPYINQAIASGALLLAVVALNWVLTRAISRASIKSLDLRRRWILQVRNVCFVLLIFGLVVIWATELRTLAFSLVAFFVAIVIATKELILCLTGSILKATSSSFTIGDRIEINGIRGDVVDQTLLTTRLMEVGPGQITHQYTGRSIVIPNAQFLTANVINESYLDPFVLHLIVTPIKRGDDWRAAEQCLLDAAHDACKGYLNEARAAMKRLERKGLEPPTVDPRVTIEQPDPDRINLVLRLPTRLHEKGQIEQAIRRRLLQHFTESAAVATDAAADCATQPEQIT